MAANSKEAPMPFYFGVGKLNMRAKSSVNFLEDDLYENCSHFARQAMLKPT
jgi:hypothetical protein